MQNIFQLHQDLLQMHIMYGKTNKLNLYRYYRREEVVDLYINNGNNTV